MSVLFSARLLQLGPHFLVNFTQRSCAVSANMPSALVILAAGAEEMEAVITVDVLRRGGVSAPQHYSASGGGGGLLETPECAFAIHLWKSNRSFFNHAPRGAGPRNWLARIAPYRARFLMLRCRCHGLEWHGLLCNCSETHGYTYYGNTIWC